VLFQASGAGAPPPTQEELARLADEINRLTPARLQKLVERFRLHLPGACEQASHAEIEIDLDALTRKEYKDIMAHMGWKS